MPSKPRCSRTEENSALVARFLERSGLPDASPWEVMDHHVSRLRKSAPPTLEPLSGYLAARNVLRKTMVRGLPCDGYIEPLGARFSDGFHVVLKAEAAATRMRFTTAHEICHTFFYHLVPEVKFRPHETDALEERLCNYGAAALLLPAPELRARAERVPVSLRTLEELSREYGVSLQTMFFRLLSLGVWDCQLSFWYRTKDGGFALSGTYGGQPGNWKWTDGSIPARAWEQRGSGFLNTRTFVYLEGVRGNPVKRVYCQLKRRGDALVALWRARKFKQPKETQACFTWTAPGRAAST